VILITSLQGNFFYIWFVFSVNFLCSEQTRGNPGAQSNGTKDMKSMSAEPPEVKSYGGFFIGMKGRIRRKVKKTTLIVNMILSP
jgi:hypothetical protein